VTSLDDTHERLLVFRRDLAQFTEQMAGSLAALRDHHTALDDLWRDSFRARYDDVWEPLVADVSAFRDHESPEYDRFLEAKIRSLDEYLHGTG
jgi:hypothetical protein